MLNNVETKPRNQTHCEYSVCQDAGERLVLLYKSIK